MSEYENDKEEKQSKSDRYSLSVLIKRGKYVFRLKPIQHLNAKSF